MASYANDAEDTPVDRAKRTLAFASATSSEAPTPAGPPLSPYRDPSANCDPSEAPTPVRERRRESPPPDEPENAEEESLRLALELQEREERYAREQEEGAVRHAELAQRRREEASDGSEGEEGLGSAWKSNFPVTASARWRGNSTPSTRRDNRTRWSIPARWRGEATPSTRRDNLTHCLISTQATKATKRRRRTTTTRA